MMVKGCLIKNKSGSFLSSRLFWIPFEDINKLYVHKEEDLESIKTKLIDGRNRSTNPNSWFPPTEIVPAQWSEEKGVEIVGTPLPWTV